MNATRIRLLDLILPKTTSPLPLVHDYPNIWKVFEIEWSQTHNGADSCLIAMPSQCLRFKPNAKPTCGTNGACKKLRMDLPDIGTLCPVHGGVIRLPYKHASFFERFCPSLGGVVPDDHSFQRALRLCIQGKAVFELHIKDAFPLAKDQGAGPDSVRAYQHEGL